MSSFEGSIHWPAEVVRAPRARRGSPSAPVPWALFGFGRGWAWNPGVGLTELPDLGAVNATTFLYSPLSRDGRTLTYWNHTSGGPQTRGEQSFVFYDVLSATRALGPPLERSPVVEPYFSGPGGERITEQVQLATDGSWQSSRAVLDHGEAQTTIPIAGRIFSNFSGAAAQFSPNGRRIAMSIGYSSEPRRRLVSVLNLDTGNVEQYPELQLAGSGAWSADGTRLLVSDMKLHPVVFDLNTGTRTGLDEILPIWERQRERGMSPVGWIDDRHLLVYLDQPGARLLLRAINVDSAEQHDLLDLPRPGSLSDFRGIMMAQDVVFADPESIWAV